jgi:hypothetical protein
MSSWEDRMAARATRRERARHAFERENRLTPAEEQARFEAETQEASQAEFEAGPPDGCTICYHWGVSYWPGDPGCRWFHFTIEAGDCMCRHECHSEPEWCGLVAYAGTG